MKKLTREQIKIGNKMISAKININKKLTREQFNFGGELISKKSNGDNPVIKIKGLKDNSKKDYVKFIFGEWVKNEVNKNIFGDEDDRCSFDEFYNKMSFKIDDLEKLTTSEIKSLMKKMKKYGPVCGLDEKSGISGEKGLTNKKKGE